MKKPPLLLIHGITASGRVWDPLVPLLEARYQLIVPTLVGHCGGPPLPTRIQRPLDVLVEGLEHALDRGGHQRVHILGNSLGGWLAFELAGRGRARSVLALSPGQGWEGDVVPRRVERFFRRASRLAPYAAVMSEHIATRRALRWLALRDVVAHPERVAAATAAEMLRASAECPMLEVFGEAAMRGDFRSQLDPIDVPVIIAWAERDRVLPYETCSAHFRTMLPDAEWRMVPDAGHVSMLDQPQLVADILHELTARAVPATSEAAPLRSGRARPWQPQSATSRPASPIDAPAPGRNQSSRTPPRRRPSP